MIRPLFILAFLTLVASVISFADCGEKNGKALSEPIRIVSPGIITFYALSPDGMKMAFCEVTYRSGKAWSELVLLDLEKGKELKRSAPEQGLHSGGVFSPDGKALAVGSGGFGRGVALWDAVQWKKQLDFEVPAGSRFCVPLAFNPKATVLAGVSGPIETSGSLSLWDVKTGKHRIMGGKIASKEEKTAGSRSDPKAVCFSDDGERFCFVEHHASGGTQLLPWDLVKGKPLGGIRAPSWEGPTSDSMEYQAKQGRGLAGSPTVRWRFHVASDGRILVFPKYKQLPIAAVAQRDGSVSIVAIQTGEWLVGNPIPGGEEKELCRLDDFKGTTLRSCVLSVESKKLVVVGIDPRSARTDNPRSLVAIWDVSAVQAAKVAEPKSAELDRYWQDLASDDNLVAHRSMVILAAFPESASGFLRKKLGSPLDIKRIPKLIKDLDADFAARDFATRELSRFGRIALPFMQEALKKSPSPEARNRLDQILKSTQETALGSELRLFRIIDILENARPSDKLLESIGKGDFGDLFVSPTSRKSILEKGN